MLSDDVRELCRNSDELIREYFSKRSFFLAKNAVDAYDYKWLNWIFSKTRDKLRIETANGNPPRLYDLRHTFATHRLYQWMHEKEDLYAVLPYLSAYMGHASLSETFHYIHLVPGMLETMSGFKYESAADIFPKAVNVYE